MNRKILLVGPVPPPYGGIPTYVKSLSESELKERYELILFNTAIPSTLRSLDTSVQRGYLSLLKSGLYAGINLIVYAIFSLITFAFNMIKRSPKVVHVFSCTYWGFWRNALYVLIAKLFGRKVIFHILGAIDIFYSRESGNFGEFLIRKALNLADLHIVQSPKLRDFVSAISKRKVIAIFNGVDFEMFDKKPHNRQLKLSQNGKIVLTVGSLGHNKGTFDIFNAIPLVNESDSKALFYFVGRGDISKLSEICRKRGIEKYVKFLGAVSEEEKVKLYFSADIFILPSYAEGQPIAILEAMAAGLPVISTTVGSIPEVITKGEHGFLIEPGDYNSLAENIKLLLREDKLRNKIGQCNYEVAREKYDMNRVFSEIARVYDDLGDY